jgi:hypothetical protein
MFKSLTPASKAHEARDMARRARRLAAGVTNDADRARLHRYAMDLELQAGALEQRAGGQDLATLAPALSD